MITELPERNWRARGGNVSLLDARQATDSDWPSPSQPGFLQRPITGNHPYLLLEAISGPEHAAADSPMPTFVVAIGVRSSGHREILGASVPVELGADFWLSFLHDLRQRGLSGVQLVTADAHDGLELAMRAVLPSAAWQRCLTHFMGDAVNSVPASARVFATAALRRVFAQPDIDGARRAIARLSARIARRNPRLVAMLRQADPACLTYYGFPAAHRQQIWSTNTERLAAELARRFAQVDRPLAGMAALRLASAVLEQQHTEWWAAGVYCRRVGDAEAEPRRRRHRLRSMDISSRLPVLVGAA